VDHIDVAVDARIDIGRERSREAAYLRGQIEAPDGSDDLVLGCGGRGKARFDGVDSYVREMLCNTEFLFTRE
jgi:hypothetical protein